MEIEKSYKWMEVSEEGHLVEPENFGPYYSQNSLNGCNGSFESEEAAVSRLEEVVRDYKKYLYCELILVPVYRVVR